MANMNTCQLKTIAVAGVLCCFTAISINANAAKKESNSVRESSTYIIKDGDYLGGIAMSHGVTVEEIIETNHLENPDKIYSGMALTIPGAIGKKASERPAPKKPKKIYVEVPKGMTLSRIAKVYGVSVSAIVRANDKLKNPDNVRAGTQLLIPGATREIELVPPPPCYNPAIEFYRVRTDDSTSIHLTYCDGKPNPAGVNKLSHFTSPVNLEKMPFPLHPRLAVLLQKVADHYPGRRLEIVSAQRLQKRKNHESLHNKGRAIDFRVAGIPNRTLITYVRQFDNTGVGYYPNSVFIHMDTRKKNAYWVDYSRPGERAIYARAGMTSKDIERIRMTRLAKKIAVKAQGVKSGSWRSRKHTVKNTVSATDTVPPSASNPNGVKGAIRPDSDPASDAAGNENPSRELATLPSAGQV